MEIHPPYSKDHIPAYAPVQDEVQSFRYVVETPAAALDEPAKRPLSPARRLI